jgi:polysaccharide biosynthesis transport protein
MSVASQSPRPVSPGPFADAQFDLPGLGAALWRKKWRILGPTILAALVTFGVVQLITPKYLSESRILIEARDNIFLRPDVDKDIIDRGTVDQEAVASQAQLILSRDLAGEVIAKLKLNENPEFDPVLKGVSPIKAVLGMIGIIKNPMRMTPQERVLESYYDRLTVYPVEKSRVIVIDFLSEDPELAARVANAIADAYLQRQQAAKQDQARNASEWLAGEIEGMRKKVADAEAKVEAFRAKSNLLVGPNNTTLSAQQLGDVNAQLAGARAQKADAEAKAKLIRDMLRSGGPIESSDILNSELIRRLSEQRVTLRAQLAEQSSSLLDNHPRIKELKAQIADLDKQIRIEAETLARSFENDAKLASARMDSLISSLDQLKSLAAGTNEQDVQLRALERDAKSQRDLLESYLAKYREATARDTLNSAPADARVISRATVSNVPAYPKKLPTVLIASLAMLVLCSGWVLTQELLAAPASAARVPVGAGLPAADALRRAMAGDTAAEPEEPARAIFGKAKPEPTRASAVEQDHEQDQEDDASSLAPAAAAAGLPVSAVEDVAYCLRHAEAGGNRVAVLAASHGVDTGPIAIKLARSLAQDGRVVLVGLGAADAAIKAISTDPAAPGLDEFAGGTASFGDIITKDKASELHLIASGRAATDRIAILSAPGMATSFQALARSYDYVVVSGGAAWGPEMEALSELAPQAILLTETVNAVTESARERLLFAGFDDVTILVGARSAAAGSKAAAAA